MGNDDVGMLMIAGGAGTSPHPSPYMMFTNPLLGIPLSQLYRWLPLVPWYYLMMCGVRLLAGAVVSDTVLRQEKRSWPRVALLVAYFATADLAFHVFIQFTIAAATAAQAAVVLWLARAHKRCWSWRSLTVFLLLLVLSAAIRLHSCLLILAMASPLFLLETCCQAWAPADPASIGARGRMTTACRSSLGPVALGAAAVAAAVAFQSWFYHRAAGWRDFEEYAHLRGEFTDYQRGPYGPDTRPVYDRVGWSSNDWDMVACCFFFADREVYGMDKLRQVVNATAPPPPSGMALHDQVVLYSKNPLVLGLTAALLLPIAFLSFKARAWRVYGIVLVGGAVLWFLMAAVWRRCPDRVVLSMLPLPVLCGTLFASRTDARGLGRWVRIAGALAAAGLLAYCCSVCWPFLRSESTRVKVASRTLKEQVRRLTTGTDRLYVVWGGSFPFEWILPRDSLATWRRFKVYSFGCPANTPLADDRLREFGIDDLMQALYTRDDVLLISGAEYVPCMITYLREHRHVETEAHQVSFLPPGVPPLFPVYKLSRVAPAKP